MRSRGGNDPVNCLWVLDPATGIETLVADPHVLLGGTDENLPPEERARRERARESAGGVVGYATDSQVTVAAFALSGRLFAAGLVSATSREIAADGPVFDPRPDPPAQRIAYASNRSLRIAELDGSSWELAGDDDPDVTWGQADFIAAEEMGQSRGYWWSPDGSMIAACRVDTSPVTRWFIADPAQPVAARPGAPVPGGRNRQRPGRAVGSRHRRRPHPGRVGPSGLPLSGPRLVGRPRPCAADRPIPRPAHGGRAARRRSNRGHERTVA